MKEKRALIFVVALALLITGITGAYKTFFVHYEGFIISVAIGLLGLLLIFALVVIFLVRKFKP